MSSDLISVCVTTFNRKGLIEKTINSIICQTYNNLEIFIVDDCSVDGTEDYILKKILILDSRIRYFRHEINKGLSSARNTALKNANGKYFTWCDDDDELEPDSIERRLKLMNYEEKKCSSLVVVYSGCNLFDTDLDKFFYIKPRIKGNISEFLKRGVLSTIPSSGLYNIELILRTGGFDENLKSFVDHDFWLSLSKANYYAAVVDDPLTNTFFYSSKKSMVTDVPKRIEGIESYIYKWESYFDLLMGKEKSRIFLRNYRKQVIGDLTALTLAHGNRKDAIRLINYLLLNVGLFNSIFYVLRQYFKQILRPLYYQLRNIVSKSN